MVNFSVSWYKQVFPDFNIKIKALRTTFLYVVGSSDHNLCSYATYD